MKDNLVRFRSPHVVRVADAPLVEQLQLLAFKDPLAIVAVRQWVAEHLTGERREPACSPLVVKIEELEQVHPRGAAVIERIVDDLLAKV
jgi:hypothetical protein